MTGHVLITDDPKHHSRAVTITTAKREKGTYNYWIDPKEDLHETRKALALFPQIREHMPADVLHELNSVFNLKLPNLADEWVQGRTVGQLLGNVPTELSDKLYGYQWRDCAYAAARLTQDDGAYLGWDRGLGKTLAAIVVAKQIEADRIIIVTPNSSKDAVWRPEIEKWDTDHQWSGRVFNLQGNVAARDRVMKTWKEYGGILLVHYEGLRLINHSSGKVSNGFGEVDLVICDEAHRLSNGHGGVKAPIFYKCLKKIPATYRLAMSGSIIVNSPEDIYGAAHWILPQHYRSRWSDWNDRFLEYTDAFGQPKTLIGVRLDAIDELRDELSTWMLVRSKEDELPGLPDKVEQTVFVELTKAQRKVYDELAEWFVAELPDGEVITTPNVLSQLTKLRQVATGLDLLGESFTDSAKIDLCLEMIEATPGKTVVFAWHRATVAAISDRLTKAKIQHVTIDGDVNNTKRGDRVAAFQTDPNVKVIVATIKTLSESVTLHAAADLIFVESSWTPADMEQAADRIYRIGQKEHVTITHILAKDTVDEHRVLPRLKTKEDLRRAVLGGS